MNASLQTKILGLAAIALGIPACGGGQPAPATQASPAASATAGQAGDTAAQKGPAKDGGAEMSCGANGCGGKP